MKGSEYLALLVDDVIDQAVDKAVAYAREERLAQSPAEVEAIIRCDLGRQRDEIAKQILDRRWNEFVDAVEAGNG